MGATGQDPKKWSTSSWWFTQYSGSQKTKALYWREHAARVWDCNGLAEGIYKDFSGVDINTQARYNYANWCTQKGTGTIPKNMRVPGAAVFIYSSSSGYITHVGYLWKPIDAGNPSGDWYVIEARGVMYGVVCTRLGDRSWNRWGLMEKYFDYSAVTSSSGSTSSGSTTTDAEFGHRTLKKGCTGNDVKALQQALIDLGFSCGKYGADGEFGSATLSAVKAFQLVHGLEVDGIVGEKTFAKLRELMIEDGDPIDPPAKSTIQVTGGTVNIRDQPSTAGRIMKIAKLNETYPGTGNVENGWYEITFNEDKGWIFGKYAKEV